MTRRVPLVAAAVFALMVTATVLAQQAPAEAPNWVLVAGQDPFSRAGQGAAYVEAFAYPIEMRQIETGLFVACEPANADGYDLFVWIGSQTMPAKDPLAGAVEVLTRREQEEVRAHAWALDRTETTVRAPDGVRAELLDDLRRGGMLALRVSTDPALGAAQPTFQFAVDGFGAIEAELDCRADQPGSASRINPLTGLRTFDSSLTDFGPLPAQVNVDRVVEAPELRAVALVGAGLGEELRGISFQCLPDAGANGVFVTVASPALRSDEIAYLVLFDDGVELGEAVLEWAFERDGTREAFVSHDGDEVGVYLALLLYRSVDALLLDELDEVIDHWRIEARGFPTAIDALGCPVR